MMTGFRSLFAVAAGLAVMVGCASSGGISEREMAWSFDQPDVALVQGVELSAFDSEVADYLALNMASMGKQVRFYSPQSAVAVETRPAPDAIVERRIRQLIDKTLNGPAPKPVTVLYDLLAFYAEIRPEAFGSKASAAIAVHIQVTDLEGRVTFDKVFECSNTSSGLSTVVGLGARALRPCLDDIMSDMGSSKPFWAAVKGNRHE